MSWTGWTAPPDILAWPSSEKVWRVGAPRRRLLRASGGILLLAAAVAFYAWSIAPFGGPNSSQRYFFVLLQGVGAGLVAAGFVLILMTFLGGSPSRIAFSAEGIRVHQREARTGKDLPFEPALSWAQVASQMRFVDCTDSGDELLSAVPFVIKRQFLTWGGVDRDGYDAITRQAAAAGFGVRKSRRGRLVVHSFAREKR